MPVTQTHWISQVPLSCPPHPPFFRGFFLGGGFSGSAVPFGGHAGDQGLEFDFILIFLSIFAEFANSIWIPTYRAFFHCLSFWLVAPHTAGWWLFFIYFLFFNCVNRTAPFYADHFTSWTMDPNGVFGLNLLSVYSDRGGVCRMNAEGVLGPHLVYRILLL